MNLYSVAAMSSKPVDRIIKSIPHIILITVFILGHPGCDPAKQDIIDPSIDLPFIEYVTIEPDVIDTDTIFINDIKLPTDILQISLETETTIQPRGQHNFTVYYSLKSQTNSELILDISLPLESLDGTSPIVLATPLEFEIQRSELGRYPLEVHITTSEGFKSNSIIKLLDIVRTNQPPEIVSITAPDTINISQTGGIITFPITVEADDPDGVDDVVRVQFINIQPDGEIRGPFDLLKKQPGIFEIIIQIDEDAKRGTHRFEFQAFDRSNEPSEIVSHEIEII